MATALATVDDLLSRTNALDVGDIRPLLFECLVSATIQLRGILRFGDWDKAAQVVETFQITGDQAKRLSTNRFLSFRVHNGLIDETTNRVLVRYGISEDQLDAAANLDAEFLKIDLEQGMVRFDTYGFQDSFISVYKRLLPSNYAGYLFRITYDHGLDTFNTADGKIYSNVPDWLKEATLIKAREIYQLTNPAVDVKAAAYSGNLQYLVEEYMRYEPLSVDPIV